MPKPLITLLSILLSGLLLTACANQPEQASAAPAAAVEFSQIEGYVKACKDPRPEMCTREYRPVCASLRCESGDCTQSIKSYSNGCVACRDSQVVKYKPGRCPGDE